MMRGGAALAKTVVYRHPCDCASASRSLQPGEEPQHRFDVDGQPFPWHMTPAGATFTKVEGAYLVSCTVFPAARDNNEPLRAIVGLDGYLAFEHVNGSRTVFPWLTIAPVTITADHDGMVAIELTFLAEHVDTDGDINDRTDEPRDGDPCPRCQSSDTWATQEWEEPILVCRSCNHGT